MDWFGSLVRGRIYVYDYQMRNIVELENRLRNDLQ